MTITVADMERAYNECGTFTGAAKQLGVGRTNLVKKLRYHGIVPHYGGPEREDRKIPNREVSDGLLVRLLKYHGDNPPDEESAAAIAHLRKMFGRAKPRPAPAPVEPDPEPEPTLVEPEEPEPAPKITARDIIKAVAERHGVTVPEIKSARVFRHLVRIRWEAFWLISKTTSLSLPQIGRAFCSDERPCGYDHTTVLHGIRKYQKLIDDGAVPCPDFRGVDQRCLNLTVS